MAAGWGYFAKGAGVLGRWDASLDDRTAGVLAALSDAIFVTTISGRILRLNPAAENLLGRESADFEGDEAPYGFWPSDEQSRLSNFVTAALRSHGPPPWTDTWFAHASGRLVPVRLTVASHMSYSIQIVTRRIEDADPAVASDPIRDRLASLENGLRNIAWEMQAMGVQTSSGWVQPGSLPPSALRELSGRQREVLDAFLAGHSVAATAAQLHLSEHTVRSHLKVIYRKMGVRSKTELMRRLTLPDAD